jgi:hypothetical protein
MLSSFRSNRSTHERVVDVMLFLISQSSSPSLRDWYDAVDDLFPEFTEDQKKRVVETGMLMLERKLKSAPAPLRKAA